MRFNCLKSIANWTLVVIILAITSITLSAQSINGSITGVITDQTGAAIAGAIVKVRNLGTASDREIVTTDQGIFRIAGLPIGIYSVRVDKSGFQPKAIEKLEVNVGTDSYANFSLAAADIQEVVTVSDVGALLEATQSQVVKTVDNRKIMELPGRNNLNGLALLNPGVVPNQNNRPGSGFAVNGNRTRSNNFTLDGANNNDQSLSTPRMTLPPEAIQEFQMVTNTFSAEYGRNAGSYVNVISKSGTNEFHGVANYTWQGNGLDALTTGEQRSFNSNVKGMGEYLALRNARSVVVNNAFGGVFHGPVKKDHTFFFGSADYNPIRQTVSSVTRPAITAEAAQRLRDAKADFAPGAVDYLLNTFPVANDPTSVGSVTVKNPRTGTDIVIPVQTFNRSKGAGIPYGTDFQRYIGKANTKINDKDQLSFRVIYSLFENPGAPANLPGTEVGQTTKQYFFTLNDVYAVSSNLINESRLTYSRLNTRFPENLPTQFTITGFPAAAIGNQNFPQFRTDNSYELSDNMTYSRGNHNWKFGANLMRYDLNSFFAPNFRGTIQYPSLADFLNDRLASVSQYAGEGYVPAKTYETGFFVQDDWRVSPNLTLNLGARYEYVTTPFGFFSNAKSDINNLAPAIGFAWNPKGFRDGRFVLRGGYRTGYDQVFQNVLLNVGRNYPRGVTVARDGVTGERPYASPLVAPQPEEFVKRGGNPNLLALRLFSPNKRYEQPMSMQYSLGIQYQLARDYVVKLDYIGTKGTHLIREVESNFGFVPASGLGNGNRIDPTKGSVLIGDGVANSIYHSGQVTLEKRFSQIKIGSLNFNVNYTYSSFISESDDVLGGQANRTLPADPRNARLDRARSGFDQPHRFVASYIYELPKLVNNLSGATGTVIDRIANGWEVSGITTLASGTPYTVFSGNNQLGILPGQIATVHLSQRVSVNPNGIYPLISTPASPNPNARFILHPSNSGILGGLGANTERTGGINSTNLALVKRIRTTESQRLDLRWEVTNIFNHRSFTLIPANTVTGTTNMTTFLDLGQTNVTGRQMLLTLRYQF